LKKAVLISSLVSVILSANLNAALPSNSLDTFLNSEDIRERKTAYLDILRNKDSYIDPIQLRLESFRRTKDQRFSILNKLICLTAIIRSEKFISTLWEMYEDYDYIWEDCIYSCPIIFTLTLYTLYTDWSPPKESKNADNSMGHDLNAIILWARESRKLPLIRGRSGMHFRRPEDQEWLRQTESLPEEQLIEIVGPENPDSDTRLWASTILANTVVDSANLIELYWLAIEDMTDDASGLYRGSIYRAILRAERAKTEANTRI
jgi:hypothetical protein